MIHSKIKLFSIGLLISFLLANTGIFINYSQAQFIGVNSQVLATQSLNTEQLIKQGLENYQAGKIKAAIASWKQALTDEKSFNVTQTAEILTYLGTAHFSLRDYEQALDYYQNALDIFQESKNLKKTIDILGKTGIIYYQLSQYDTAIQVHQQQLNLVRQSNSSLAEATTLGNLAINQKALGHYRESRQNLQQALQIIQPLSQFRLEAKLCSEGGKADGSTVSSPRRHDAT